MRESFGCGRVGGWKAEVASLGVRYDDLLPLSEKDVQKVSWTGRIK